MKIREIRLQRFRQFRDTRIEVGDFNLLVGPNNCGKTSVLHAIRAFFALMNGHVRFEGAPPVAKYHRRFLSSADEIAPTPDIWELWYRRQAGQPAKISVTFEDGTSFTVILRQQFGQIHVSAEDLPAGLTADHASACLETPVAFIPGLVGVLVVERTQHLSGITLHRCLAIERGDVRLHVPEAHPCPRAGLLMTSTSSLQRVRCLQARGRGRVARDRARLALDDVGEGAGARAQSSAAGCRPPCSRPSSFSRSSAPGDGAVLARIIHE